MQTEAGTEQPSRLRCVLGYRLWDDRKMMPWGEMAAAIVWGMFGLVFVSLAAWFAWLLLQLSLLTSGTLGPPLPWEVSVLLGGAVVVLMLTGVCFALKAVSCWESYRVHLNENRVHEMLQTERQQKEES